jgi:hypothetical protein
MTATKMSATNPTMCTIGPLLERLRQDFTDINFVAGKAFCWSPNDRRVCYKAEVSSGSTSPTVQTSAVFSLLHEVGHALLEHRRYRLDFELLELELAAWQEARLLGKRYGITICEDHVQNCLDTYRDWLYRRSICPTCSTRALQQDSSPAQKPSYRCFNCHATWLVASSRFCRPYRQIKGQLKGRQPATAVFTDRY